MFPLSSPTPALAFNVAGSRSAALPARISPAGHHAHILGSRMTVEPQQLPAGHARDRDSSRSTRVVQSTLQYAPPPLGFISPNYERPLLDDRSYRSLSHPLYYNEAGSSSRTPLGIIGLIGSLAFVILGITLTSALLVGVGALGAIICTAALIAQRSGNISVDSSRPV